MARKKAPKPGRQKKFDDVLKLPLPKEWLDKLKDEAEADGTYPTVVVRRLIARHLEA